jgi:hypothetical protein
VLDDRPSEILYLFKPVDLISGCVLKLRTWLTTPWGDG